MARTLFTKALGVFGKLRVTGDAQVDGNATVSGALGFTNTGAVTFADAVDVTFGASTGTKIGGTGSKLALYGTTAIAQPTRLGQLTDSSGGTSGGATVPAIAGTIGDATAATVASTADAVATLAAKVNALELKLHNVGVTA